MKLSMIFLASALLALPLSAQCSDSARQADSIVMSQVNSNVTNIDQWILNANLTLKKYNGKKSVKAKKIRKEIPAMKKELTSWTLWRDTMQKRMDTCPAVDHTHHHE